MGSLMPAKDGMQPGSRPAEGAAPTRLHAGPGPVASRVASLTPDQFASMYSDAWRVLWCAAVSVVRDRTLAQDIVQQAAIVGLEHLSDFDPGTNFVSWMVRIVKNIGLNEARKTVRRRTTPTEAAALEAAPGVAGASQAPVLTGRGQVVPGQDAFDDDVLHALDDLDETARGCLLLRVVLNMAYRDIAQALDIPEGTAASHVHRARRFMRDRLRSRYAGALQGEPS
jgi:RNA polymerase sigma-70 factor (ECF subfamily)